uniref:Uncharacterized protein n=1 Tax=Anolis carolinensis TaxID=28377 RepID=A0A803TLT1_ANOCA
MEKPMALRVLHIIGLWLLLTSEIATLDCGQIVKYQSNETGKTLGILKAMAGQQSSQECLEDPDFGFPRAKILKCSQEDAKMAIGLILQQIQIVFQLNFTQAQWSGKVTDLLSRALDQQHMQWRRCATAQMGKEAAFKDLRVMLSLKRYFRKLHTFLRGRQYSFCAWKMVRYELLVIYPIVLNELMRILEK